MALDIQSRLKRVFGEDALDWFHMSYIFDWSLLLIGWFIIRYIKDYMSVTERSFSLHDPLISHPHRKNQVSSAFNQFVAFIVPCALVVIAGFLKRSLMDIHHGIVGLLATRTLATLVIDFLKNRVGRLRPDFLARCKWDKHLEECTGKLKDIVDGRKSFPSGHSATAWSGMFYASLFIAGQTAAWCFYTRKSPRIVSSRLVRLVFTVIPLVWALHVALTRMEDYRHHKEDVIVGSTIGVLSAWICYHIFWPNPCSASTFSEIATSEPRSLYVDLDRHGEVEFELAAVDEDRTNAV
ncbi:lipid phosphate phosphatase 1 [Ephemerocybe angulata]|uniref:Lipid phosphate phosphatase 1 n=1 Tax=Ephemerocybe angulata TaxID=980116 RepID=A0A8H6ICG4_9AGAR|nr:lipid phosphate phosphatase 1 [Tulosesus angulatus]